MARRRNASPSILPESQNVEAVFSLDDLRREWRRLYHQDAPKISRDLLTLGIAYRRQELQHGTLGKATIRKLKTIAKTLRETGRISSSPGLALKPGARLVREWNGRTHTVMVIENGYDYSGQHYTSLTSIACAITGTQWSGPRFFGLNDRSKSSDRSSEQTNGSA